MSYLVAGHVLLFKNVTLKALNVIIDKTSTGRERLIRTRLIRSST